MSLSDKKAKAKRLEVFLGEYVNIYLASTKMIDNSIPGQSMVSSVIQGYVIDMDESFIYLGPTLEEFVAAVNTEEIGVIAITSEELEAIELPNDGGIH